MLAAGPVQSEADVRRALKRAQEAKVPFEVRCDLLPADRGVPGAPLVWGSLQPLPTPTTRSFA